MIKIENLKVYGFEEAIRGTRNAMNSWDKSDSYYTYVEDTEAPTVPIDSEFHVGDADLGLMMRLGNGGPVHAKGRRYIDVYVDITAPLYWWKEFETYRIGVCENPSDIEINSCSTMHKIHAKEFTIDDFSCEHLWGSSNDEEDTDCYLDDVMGDVIMPLDILGSTIDMLNNARTLYLETKDKKYWWQMIQLLPSSYNQRRTIKLNYEVLTGMYRWRKDHKLDEWRELMRYFKENLPHSELFTTDFAQARIDAAVKEELEKFVEYIKSPVNFVAGFAHPDSPSTLVNDVIHKAFERYLRERYKE